MLYLNTRCYLKYSQNPVYTFYHLLFLDGQATMTHAGVVDVKAMNGQTIGMVVNVLTIIGPDQYEPLDGGTFPSATMLLNGSKDPLSKF